MLAGHGYVGGFRWGVIDPVAQEAELSCPNGCKSASCVRPQARLDSRAPRDRCHRARSVPGPRHAADFEDVGVISLEAQGERDFTCSRP